MLTMGSPTYNEILNGPAPIRIGKDGLTQGTIDHFKIYIKKHKMFKVKILKEIAHEQGVDTIINEFLDAFGGIILDVRGFTFVWSKKLPKRVHPVKKYLRKVKKKEQRTEEKVEEKIVEKTIKKEDNSNINSKENQKENQNKIKEQDKDHFIKKKRHDWDNTFIDYDNDDLLEEIDAEGDYLYGGTPPTFINENEESDENDKNLEKKNNSKSNIKRNGKTNQKIHGHKNKEKKNKGFIKRKEKGKVRSSSAAKRRTKQTKAKKPTKKQRNKNNNKRKKR